MRERALQSRTLTDRRSITLPLCVLAAGAIHGLAVMALLPMMITLPGPRSVQQGASQAVDVDVLPSPVAVPHDPETTAAIPAVADHSLATLAPDRDADDAYVDDESVPAEPGIAATPEPSIEPGAAVITRAVTRIPEPPAADRESEPAELPASAADEASPPPEAEAKDEAPGEAAATPVARLEPVRLDSPAAESAAAAAVAEPTEAEPEAGSVEEDVPPPEAEAAKGVEPEPDAKAIETPPVPTAKPAKPAKAAEPKPRSMASERKVSKAPAKRRTSRPRRSTRTRTVTTTTRGGLFQSLFGPPQQAMRATSRSKTKRSGDGH